jgi:hypothetical protein
MVPLALLLVVAPMFAAGRGGLRPFLLSLAGGWGAVALIALLNAPTTIDLFRDWRENGGILIAFLGLTVLSVTMGGLVLYVRWAEERRPDTTRCRRCGYDLRASPDRCPECGTPTRPEPESV